MRICICNSQQLQIRILPVVLCVALSIVVSAVEDRLVSAEVEVAKVLAPNK